MKNKNKKIVIFGAAGLVGHNLCLRLNELGYKNIIAIDKNVNNTKNLKSLGVCKSVINCDINDEAAWSKQVNDADIFILSHAQISSMNKNDFTVNNIQATQKIIDFLENQNDAYVIHISSSVVNSKANDFYTETKEIQEELVVTSLNNYCVLRPTLMFGWFDRKHLGWLSRFMSRTPIFPVPGNGKYSRQPLYVRDFCNVIIGCIEMKPFQKVYDISGLTKVSYIEIIKGIKKVKKLRSIIISIPVFLFRFLLNFYSIFSKNPPFTSSQLDALIIPEDFPTHNWEEIFGITSTPFELALEETFTDNKFSEIELEF